MKNGCQFCGLVLQASSLFRTASLEPPLSIHIYRNSPAKIHSESPGEYYDVVEIYAFFNEPSWQFPQLAKEIPMRADSLESLEFLKRTYSTCVTEHEECRHTQTCLPTRVVDISGEHYRLVEPEPFQRDSFAALSYCWGPVALKLLTSQTIDQLKKIIGWDAMPICFQDAAKIARQLGIRYLWIDTLCIIQNDGDDWDRESGKMAEVYEKAAIVIAAGSTSNPHDSFLVEKDQYFKDVVLGPVLLHNQQSVIFKARRKVALGIHSKLPRTGPQNPLEQRAWTLQEQRLATRYISFTRAELQWECRRLSSCECQMSTYTPIETFGVDTSKGKENSPYSYWHLLVQDYTARNLTFVEDKLPAIGGLAKKFSISTGATYLAGLWKENLPEDLAWQRDSRVLLRPVDKFIAPSFSWASISAPVNYQPARKSYPGTRLYHAEVVEAECATKITNSFGHSTGGFMTIHGPTVVATIRSSNAVDAQSYTLSVGEMTFNPNTFQKENCEFSLDALSKPFDISSIEGETKDLVLGRSATEVTESVSGNILLLSLYSIIDDAYRYEIFLLIGKSATESNAYERLGIGTGKIYQKVGAQQYPLPSSEEPRSFEWLRFHAGAGSGNLYEPKIRQIHLI